MIWRRLASATETTYALICRAGDDPVASLLRCAREQSLAASRFSGIGAFSSAVLGFFDKSARIYRHIPLETQMEVLSLLGDITLDPSGAPQIHAHVVLSGPDGGTRGGHLIAATVDPTLELIITESPTHLRRTPDAASGLALIDLDLA